MNWKFWQGFRKEQRSPANVIKLTKPKDLPDRVGIYLITQMHENPDWVWGLKWVVRRKPEQKEIMEFRVFSPSDAAMKNVGIRDFISLESHPEIILFEGLFDKETGIVKIKKTREAA